MEMSKMVFTRQFTHAVIYAWVKLREQVSRSAPKAVWLCANTLTGNSEYYMDRRMHCAKPERKDRELHQCVLIWVPEVYNIT